MSVVPVRATPSDKAEMTTQLLFGEIFTILQVSENQKWLEINILHDNYVGWVDALQCTFVSKKYFKKYIKTIPNHKVSSSHMSGVEEMKKGKTNYANNGSIIIIQGSIIPFLKSSNNIIYEKFTLYKRIYASRGLFFYDDIQGNTKKTIRKKIIENAFYYINTPYLWGGRSIFGIDCSGLVQQVFRSVGYNLPRDAYQQAEEGKLVDFDAKKQGDLAFFVRDGKIIHVGIVLKDNKIIHARGQVRIDTLDKTGILDNDISDDTNEYSHYLAFLKRIL